MSLNQRQLLLDLRCLADITPDAESTSRAVGRARAALLGQRIHNSAASKTKTMTRPALIGIAAAVLLMIAAERWLAGLTPSGSLAFGQVQQQVKQTKTVQYVQRRKDRGKDGRVGPQEMRKVKILGAHRVREEVKITTAGDRLPDGEIWTQTPDDDYVMVHDYKNGKSITLFPKEKIVQVVDKIFGIDVDSGEVKESKFEAMPEADFYNEFRAVPADRAKRLPDREINGKKSIGFQLVEKNSTGTRTSTRDYWVDPATKLPVRIEISLQSTNPNMADSEFVQSEFVFDAPLDEGLFSTDPPAGYKLK